MTKRNKAKFMEVCGTHTFAVAKYGIKNIYGGSVDFLSGPGCPVCVTSQEDIDYVIELAGNKKNLIVSFGDMIRVPSSDPEISLEKSNASNVRIIYSVGEILDIAEKNPGKNVIFPAVGFETTAPLAASVIDEAKKKKIKNFYVFCAMKTIIPAIRALLSSKKILVDGFILPGHVCAVTGFKPFEFIPAEYGIPCVTAGFSPNGLKNAIGELYGLYEKKESRLINCYDGIVTENGNAEAQNAVKKVFEKDDAVWRGLGKIKESGLKLRAEYARFDILNKYGKTAEKTVSKNTCICGKLFTGQYKPYDCKNFAKKCTPATPIGPCMVSSEGVCASFYKYGETDDK